MNARFWVFVNGNDVKLTLKPGQGLQWGKSWRHDEGWSSEDYYWRYPKDGGVIFRSHGTDGTDCDGRMSTIHESFCFPEDLQAHFVDEDTPMLPKWERINSRQRDYQAERAGY
jgi:hypothetical protein